MLYELKKVHISTLNFSVGLYEMFQLPLNAGYLKVKSPYPTWFRFIIYILSFFKYGTQRGYTDDSQLISHKGTN